MGDPDVIHVSSLPVDILVHIFSWLSFTDLTVCERVCKKWRRVVIEPYFRREAILDLAAPLLRQINFSTSSLPSVQVTPNPSSIPNAALSLRLVSNIDRLFGFPRIKIQSSDDARTTGKNHLHCPRSVMQPLTNKMLASQHPVLIFSEIGLDLESVVSFSRLRSTAGTVIFYNCNMFVTSENGSGIYFSNFCHQYTTDKALEPFETHVIYPDFQGLMIYETGQELERDKILDIGSLSNLNKRASRILKQVYSGDRKDGLRWNSPLWQLSVRKHQVEKIHDH